MEKENLFILMDPFMKVILRMINCMEKERFCMLMDQFIKESLGIIENVENNI
jgi:hypothetical protein